MRKSEYLIQGWGIKDINYNVYITEVINGRQHKVWTCPYYKDWCSMLERCFSKKTHTRQPTYKDCTVCEEWKYLSNFIKWVENQPNKDWENCQLDKDFLSNGNKHYSPETVVYVPSSLNTFVLDAKAARKRDGAVMLGVIKRSCSTITRYEATCRNPFTKKGEYLGRFDTELEAHLTWKAKKHEHSLRLACLQSDPRVVKLLQEKYAPNTDLTQT